MTLNADESGQPRWIPNIGLGDQVGAAWLAFGIAMALLSRERHGAAQEVHVSQLGSQIALQNHTILNYLMTGEGVTPWSRSNTRNPMFTIYQAQDGKWFALACLQPDR